MATSPALLTLDGSYGEGGGALLRTAFVMAALTQQPVRIQNVRTNSKFPGLDVEDITVLKVLAQMTKGETVGAEPGSSQVSFIPTSRPRGLNGLIEATRNEAKRGPNACIVLSSLLPVLARGGVYSTLQAQGETFGKNALSYDYFSQVTIPALRKVGLYAYPELTSAGFGRESNGTIHLEVEPSVLTPIEWRDRGRLIGIKAAVSYAGLPDQVADRAVGHLAKLAQNSGLQMEAKAYPVGSRTMGIFVTTWATYERAMGGGAAMGMKGVRAETLAQLAFEEMFQWMATPSTVDPFLADQLLLPLIFAEGESTFAVSKLTQRFLTCAWVIKQFIPIHITIKGSEGGPGTVTIRR